MFVDAQWLTAYCVLELEWDFPIIEAVSVFWRYVWTRPTGAPALEVDPMLLVKLMHNKDQPFHTLPHQFQTHEVCAAALPHHPLLIRWIPRQSEDLCLLALNHTRRDASKNVGIENHKPSVAEVLQSIYAPTPAIYLAAVMRDGGALCAVPSEYRSKALCLAAVQQKGTAIRWVENPTLTIKMAAVQQDGMAVGLIKSRNYQIELAAVQQNGLALEHIGPDWDSNSQYQELCLAAVMNNPKALHYVRNPTHALCRVAVQRDPCTLIYVPTTKYPDLIPEALALNGLLLNLVAQRDRTLDLCLVAVTQNPYALAYVPEPTPQILRVALTGYLADLARMMPDQHHAIGDIMARLAALPSGGSDTEARVCATLPSGGSDTEARVCAALQ